MTSGEWVMEDNENPVRPEIIIARDGKHERVIGCTWSIGTDDASVEQRKANGRAMAAAKELLAACEAARYVLIRNRECDKHTGSQIFGVMDADALAQIEAAIAKARGE